MTDHPVLSLGCSGERVRRLQAALLDNGQGIADDELVLGFFGRDTRRAVFAFQFGSQGWANGVADHDTRDKLGADAAEAATRRVVGRVVGPDLKPAADVSVEAYDRDFRSEQQLGTAQTNAGGYFVISYTRESFARAEKASADVFVRVKDGDRLLFDPPVSATQFNAGRVASVTVTLSAQPQRKQSLYEQIEETLRPLIDIAPADLRQDDENQDVTFLAGETGLAADELEFFALSHRMTQKLELPATFYFAMLVQGVLRDVTTWRSLRPRFTIDLSTPVDGLVWDIVLLPPQTVSDQTKAAVAAGVVPTALLDELAHIQETLAGQQDQARSELRAAVPAMLTEQLHGLLTSDAPATIRRILADPVVGDLPTMLDRLSAAGSFSTPSDEDQARLATAVADLIGNNADLVARVAADRQISTPADTHALAALAPADWATAIQPDGQPGPLVRQQSVALARSMEATYPTAAFAAQLGRDADPPVPHAAAVASLLGAHPDFALPTGDAVSLVASADATDPDQTAGITASLRKLQRVAAIAPAYQPARALISQGISSASDIHRLGERQFVARAVGTGHFTAPQAQAAFAKAVTVHAGSLLLAGDLASTTEALTVAALAATSPDLEPVTKAFPNLESLFQIGDMSACDDCRSVHGAAAYVADVLHFLETRLVLDTTVTPAPAAKTAKADLFARRPDLGDTDLSCPNTNTTLPYIDMVCELLEEAVVPDPGFAYSGALVPGPATASLVTALQAHGLPDTATATVYEADLAGCFVVRGATLVFKLSPNGVNTWVARRLRQTAGTAAEVAALPEYVNQDAYSVLRLSKSAFTLPFDLAHEEARAYFTTFGVQRSALMAALQRSSGPTDAQIVAEALGLSDRQHQLVVTPDPSAQQDIWNTPTVNASATLSKVDAFVTRTGLDYTDLQDLLAAGWVNPSGTMYVRHLDNTADLSAKQIINLDDAALDRIHRFVRLRNATGWPTSVLDRAVLAPAVGRGLLDDVTLTAIGDLVTSTDRLGLTPAALLDLLGPLDPTDPLGSYVATFLDPVAVGSLDPVFTAAGLTTNQGLGAAGLQLSAVTADLMLALGRSLDDITALVGMVGDTEPVTIASISSVFGYSQLAIALGLSATDLAILVRLSAATPLAGPADLLTLVAARDALGPFTAADVDYLLGHRAADLSTRELAASTVADFQGQLTSGYASARTATASAFDLAGTPQENATALRAQLSQLPGVTTVQLSAMQTLVTGTWTDPSTTPAAFVDALLAGSLDTTAIQASLVVLLAGPVTDVLRNDLISTVMAAVADHLYLVARQAALLVQLTTTFPSLDPSLAAVVLQHGQLKQPAGGTAPTLGAVLLDDGASAAALSGREAALRLLDIVVSVLTTAALSPDDSGWLLTNAAAAGWTELDGLPYESGQTPVGFVTWSRLQGFLGLLSAYPAVANSTDPTRPYTLTGFFDQVLAGGASASAITELALLTGFDPQLVTDLDALALTPGGPAAYADPAAVQRLLAAATVTRQLGMDAATALQVARPHLAAPDAVVLRTALKRRYADSEWLGVLAQTYGTVRPMKRDALVAYLLAHNPDLAGVDDLYDLFLIDVEMGGCMQTSRIVQAHATLQLFVARCLMGLEPTSVADLEEDDGWLQWSWMANFRVWEANRKIFLWPQNWIDPSLRDDKSELFVALDDALQQDALTDDSVEDATGGYLEALDDLAHLDVMATYYQTTTKSMHVFARTKGGTPAVYYHRQFLQELSWTPWETVPLDIDSDHLLAFERNDRLTLAWGIFTSQPDTDAAPPMTPDPAALAGGQANSPPNKRWQIQLATSELSRGHWRPKKVSIGYLATDFSPALPPKTDYDLFSWQLGQKQAITCLGRDGFAGSFALTGCKGFPVPQPASYSSLQITPSFRDTDLEADRFVQDAYDTPGLAISYDLGGSYSQITGKTVGSFDVTYPLQLSLVDLMVVAIELLLRQSGAGGSPIRDQAVGERGRGFALPLGTLMPYFYGDESRTYCIIPGFYPRLASKPPTDHPAGPPPPVIPQAKTFSTVLQDLEDVLTLAQHWIAQFLLDPTQDPNAFVAEVKADKEYQRLAAEFASYQKLHYGLQFANFYHPLVCTMRSAFNAKGVPGLMSRELQLTDTGFDFASVYAPAPQVVKPYPREVIGFETTDAYSSYNWELFFHLPFDIAQRLNADQQFEAARDWFHYVFNPVGAGPDPAPKRYWITKPFYQTMPAEYLQERIDSIMMTIAEDPFGESIATLAKAVEAWRDEPFVPDVVARSRPVAYQLALVTSYVENLIDWGDSLFRQFTRESVTQATQMYVLADKLLGRRPRIVPPDVELPPMTFNQLDAKLDLFGNALIDLETAVPDLNLLPHHGAELPPAPITFGSLYFCIPPNDNLLQLWDTVTDRLTKIRSCENIDGVQASLALFSPPIDPGALVRAAAAGLDIASFVAGLGAPLPAYRFATMSAKATELTQHVAALGSELLMALEKRDAEAVARLRTNQEIRVQGAVRTEKLAAIAEAAAALEGLRKSRLVTVCTQEYYQGLTFMNPWEGAAVALNGTSLIGEAAVALGYVLSGGLKLIPAFAAGGAGFGGSPTVTVTLGGQTVGPAADSAAQVLSSLARVAEKSAGMAATQGAYQRRHDEWAYQINLAGKQLDHIDQEIATAQLHIDMLNKDLAAHDLATTNAQQLLAFMTQKYTNQELYEWMTSKVTSVYYSAYQLAFDTAKKAERCLEHELASDTTYISYGYWDSARKGLMTADALLHDIKRMEAAYLDLNSREYELTKHVSLATLDPQALLTLKNTGSAVVDIPEAVFDVDHPGHYLRRLKTVGLSIPCVTGPYTTVACTLSHVANRYRHSTARVSGAATDYAAYAEQDGGDPRFTYNVGAIQSIATSSAVADNGLFELNFHDERYLPFEGTGAIGQWRIELPQDFPSFDHSTITDVVLHLRYTARDGGSAFRGLVQGVTTDLLEHMTHDQGQGLFAGVSLRNQFPDAWWQLVESGTTTFTVDGRVLPYSVQTRHPVVDTAGWYAKLSTNPASYAVNAGGDALTLNKDASLGNLFTAVGGAPTLGTPFTLTLDATHLEDLVLLLHYTVT